MAKQLVLVGDLLLLLGHEDFIVVPWIQPCPGPSPAAVTSDAGMMRMWNKAKCVAPTRERRR